MSLTWALVIATYNRQEILPRCLRLAAGQTRPPAQIVVVDASPDWLIMRQTVMERIAHDWPGIRWEYVRAERLSSAAQRNQGIRIADADVLFLLDDDSLMYGNCAEQVMRIYEADIDQKVAGIGPVEATVPPDDSGAPANVAVLSAAPKPRGAGLAALESHLTRVETCFIPYDGDYPIHAIPAALRGMNVAPVRLLGGFRMTFRRSFITRQGFEEVLERYTSAEDLDVSYRLSRHGVLLNAFDAHIYHMKSAGGRLSRYAVMILRMLNIAVLLRLNTCGRERARRRYARFLAHRFFLEILADLSRRRWSFPHVRGVLSACRHAARIFGSKPADLRIWYPQFQRDLIERHG